MQHSIKDLWLYPFPEIDVVHTQEPLLPEPELTTPGRCICCRQNVRHRFRLDDSWPLRQLTDTISDTRVPIHTYAGIQLRLDCAELMESQGYEEPTGQAKITPAYNLPCDYVIHTVGPIVQGKLKKQHCDLLASCYRSCLKLADETGITSIAFCCISTGVFMFPNEKAAEIAVQTVKEYKAETGSKMEVIFNVFKESDEQIYRKILG